MVWPALLSASTKSTNQRGDQSIKEPEALGLIQQRYLRQEKVLLLFSDASNVDLNFQRVLRLKLISETGRTTTNPMASGTDRR